MASLSEIVLSILVVASTLQINMCRGSSSFSCTEASLYISEKMKHCLNTPHRNWTCLKTDNELIMKHVPYLINGEGTYIQNQNRIQ